MLGISVGCGGAKRKGRPPSCSSMRTYPEKPALSGAALSLGRQVLTALLMNATLVSPVRPSAPRARCDTRKYAAAATTSHNQCLISFPFVSFPFAQIVERGRFSTRSWPLLPQCKRHIPWKSSLHHAFGGRSKDISDKVRD